ncbi:hypothetical protein HaLaN_28855 [Haematococcus lacustris]|uniref:Uncharacterized protein n=1 Tax=Haematococcus lacustris TaxID=44745 RepID=A0A6A0ACK5_HAELA|nr:hypothetical protein HaLaN_28855 [Haematococcus lacustris]
MYKYHVHGKDNFASFLLECLEYALSGGSTQAFPTWGWQSSCNCSPPTQSFDVSFAASAAMCYIMGFPRDSSSEPADIKNVRTNAPPSPVTVRLELPSESFDAGSHM